MLFDLELNKIIMGDAIECMKEMPDEFCHMVLTDPPYGIDKEMRSTRSRNKAKFKDFNPTGEWDKFLTKDSFMKFTFAWASEAARILKPGGMLISYFDRDKINFLSHYLQTIGMKKKGYYSDLKSNPVPMGCKAAWMNGWEIAAMWSKPGKVTFNFHLGQHKDYGIRPIVSGHERVGHPTQKPLSVIKDFIAWWTKEEDIVIDPFIGSGTTAVACLELDRKFIGIEREKIYYVMATNRIKDYATQSKFRF